jgi:uncharacterized protein (TIRG00374 family)
MTPLLKKIYKISSLILTLVILYFLIIQIKPGDIWTVLTKVRWEFLIAAFISYLALNRLRACRFYLLLRKKIGFAEMNDISYAHNFINNILPSRIGEASYLYYVRKSGRVGLGNNLASLFWARILDTLMVIVLTLISLIFIAASVAYFKQAFFLTLAGLAVTAGLFLLFIFGERQIRWLLNGFFALFKLNHSVLGNKILLKFQEAASFAVQMRERRLLASTLFLTVLIWLMIFFRVWLIAQGFGLEFNFWQAIFVGGLPALASIAPFYTIGNFGIFEGSAALGLVILGFNKELAISFSFILHASGILMAALPGLKSYFKLSK